MNDDLQHAQASVDWAVAQFPAFQARLRGWLDANVNVVVKELPANFAHDSVIAIEKEPLPLFFNVEAGAYLNAIRSSLDILSAALAYRHCPTLADDAYFPVASSADNFARGNYKGHKFIKAIPAKEREIIEELGPYKGGNAILYNLHHLDIIRKHQRLLTVHIHPSRLEISDARNFEAASIGKGDRRNGETIIGELAKGAPHPEFKLACQVSFNEATHLFGVGVVGALRQFASLANSIIGLFDFE
jgi:hypothetical protein